MEDAIMYGIVLGGIMVILFYVRNHLKYRKLPPGPRGWPLVGNAFQQDPDMPHFTWTKWAKTFGGVFTVNNFGTPTVLCNNFEAIYEMYVTRSVDFGGRPSMYAFDTATDRKDITGVDFSPEWVRRKKVFMSNIKMYGDELKHLEDIMVDIIKELENDIKSANQQPLDLQQPIVFALANTLSLLVLGHKYDRSDADFLTLLGLIDENNECLRISLQSIAVDCFPWLTCLPLPYCNMVTSFARKVQHEWGPSLIHQQMKSYNKNNIACILDGYIKQHKEDQQTGAQYPIEHKHLVLMLADFFMAGMSTSRSTLYSLFAILTAEQDIQTKVWEEVDRVLGGRHPELKDRQDMPYSQATLEEVMRYCVVVPTSVPHKAMVDSEICGHFIPKGTQVIPNIWPMCHDTEVWGDPWKFRPERFLDADGQMLSIEHPLRRRVMVFGAGRRKCPGESLARNRIFLITTSLLQKFIFKPVEGKSPVHDPRTYKFGNVIMPHPYQVIAVPRE